jgi:outer membrane protein insertion porin family
MVAAALLVLFFAAGAFSQTPGQNAPQGAPNTSTIAAITATGAQKVPVDQIISASGLKVGDVVSAAQLQGAADRLAALGIFSAVNYRFTSKGGAISLEFRVEEARTYPLSFDNFPWFTDEDIAQAIRQDVGFFTGEAPESGAMVDGISRVIDNLLASKKIKGELTHQLVARAVGDGMMVQFHIDAPALRIQSVKFDDSLATDSEQLKDRISDIKGQPYSRFAIDVFENEHILPLYSAKGFLRAKIGPPEAHLTSEPGSPSAGGVDVEIPVTPGPVYAFNGISWQGNSAIGTPNLDGAVEIKAGDPVDGMKIEALWQTIETAYASHGYLDAKLSPLAKFDDSAHRVSYQVSIVEGPQYHMGEMVITGLSVDAEKRLRQVWLIAPGQVFDNSYFETVSRQLAKPNMEIFGEMPIHYTEFGKWLRPDTTKHTVDVLLDFK